MADTNQTDPLTWNVPIVDGGGRPTNEFMRKWDQQQGANANIPDLSTAAKVSAVLDKIAATAGSLLVRGSSLWGGLATPSDATKFLNGANPPAYAKVKDTDLAVTDVTGNNVTSAAHGFAPKSPADATKFLNGATTPAYAQVKDSDLSTSNVTTNNVTTAKHGFAPILPNDATKYLDGTGNYSAPPGGGGTPANPTATAGPAAVNGTATTFMRSDAAPAIQKASASQFGIVEVDGTTITATGGIISAAPADIPSAEFAGYPATATNATGDATVYTYPAFTAEKNIGGAMNTATGVWTAPAKGVAIVSGVFGLGNLLSTHTQGYGYALRNGTDYFYCFFGNVANLKDSSGNCSLPISHAIPVNAGDTLTFSFRVSNGTKVVTLWGGISQTYLGVTFFTDSAAAGGGGGSGGSGKTYANTVTTGASSVNTTAAATVGRALVPLVNVTVNSVIVPFEPGAGITGHSLLCGIYAVNGAFAITSIAGTATLSNTTSPQTMVFNFSSPVTLTAGTIYIIAVTDTSLASGATVCKVTQVPGSPVFLLAGFPQDTEQGSAGAALYTLASLLPAVGNSFVIASGVTKPTLLLGLIMGL